MALLEIPTAIGKHNPLYKGNEDPFFTVLSILRERNQDQLNRVFSEDDARQIGVLPALLLHPSVDLSFMEIFMRESGRASELGRLAQIAIQQADTDVPPDPHFNDAFRKFKTYYFKERRPALERLAREGGHSFADMSMNEFAHAYSTYRHFVYNGSKTFTFSGRA
ncbi:MAG: hypothetical protein NTW67_06010 [Candidatus Woesearchaeota archaeon]|nr:hypothetical protein [Candidatus Woesearchaeota archaeon]